MSEIDSKNDRPLGPEMQAEGWVVIGGDWIMWLHPPSQRCVVVEGPWRRDETRGIALPHGEPAAPETEGYIVSCRFHDEHGEPIKGRSFWLESYGEAVRHGRAIRQSIVDGRPHPDLSEQLTLDDAGG